jgi:hypothetical protein
MRGRLRVHVCERVHARARVCVSFCTQCCRESNGSHLKNLDDAPVMRSDAVEILKNELYSACLLR